MKVKESRGDDLGVLTYVSDTLDSVRLRLLTRDNRMSHVERWAPMSEWDVLDLGPRTVADSTWRTT
jgi:hypothetical protein